MPQVDDLLKAPTKLSTPSNLASESLPTEPTLPANNPFSPGEAVAQGRLKAFTSGEAAPIYRYAENRDRPAVGGTAQLSPYLRFGLISARQAVVAALQAQAAAPDEAARKGAEIWLNELIWREFYATILYHFPHVRRGSFRPELEYIPWNNDEAAFTAWCEGKTGYPLVDAAMRQLKQLGWMHNRVRMIVASFLVKDLLIDWHWGEKWFMQHLLDGDPAANNGGWQWTAGTGTDASPYFRIFNPILQSKKFDPSGKYIKQWLPELANVPPKYIHEPAKLPQSEQKKYGCLIGQDYPAPIVDHFAAREQTLAAYHEARVDRPTP
jgi:deoxyribodipyrimidine photo-lyase